VDEIVSVPQWLDDLPRDSDCIRLGILLHVACNVDHPVGDLFERGALIEID
jgi:hypothetical protein